MNERLPPLTALRAFEAAARHMSFAKAADELNVTPAALSFQIKSLEEHLGHPVFRRLNRAVELTEVGRHLQPGVTDGFGALTGAWRSARRLTDETHLTVTAGPSFTAKWLAPRMFDFAQAHPEIELRFSASLRMMNFDRDDVDVAIRFGSGDYDGVFSRPILREAFTPMMTPELAERFPTPASLSKAALLFSDDTKFLSPPCDWVTWFKANGIKSKPRSGTHFSQHDHALDAALTGAGVLMGRAALASKALREQRLIAPYEIALGTEAHFRVLCPLGAEKRPHIAAFLDWVTFEAKAAEVFYETHRVIPVTEVVM